MRENVRGIVFASTFFLAGFLFMSAHGQGFMEGVNNSLYNLLFKRGIIRTDNANNIQQLGERNGLLNSVRSDECQILEEGHCGFRKEDEDNTGWASSGACENECFDAARPAPGYVVDYKCEVNSCKEQKQKADICANDSCLCPAGLAWSVAKNKCYKPKSETCPKIYSPVLGCNFKRYNSPCEAALAGVKKWRLVIKGQSNSKLTCISAG